MNCKAASKQSLARGVETAGVRGDLGRETKPRSQLMRCQEPLGENAAGILVNRILVWFKEDSEYKGIDPTELKALTDYFYNAIQSVVLAAIQGDAPPSAASKKVFLRHDFLVGLENGD